MDCYKRPKVNWDKIFELRCKSKRGERLEITEQTYISDAYEEDPERYKAMNKAVFIATAPFGAFIKQ